MRINYQKTTKNPSVLTKVDQIKGQVVSCIGKKTYRIKEPLRNRALLNLIVNLLLCLTAKDGYRELAVARDNNAYRKQERYGTGHVSRSFYVPLFDALEKLGYVTSLSGFYDRTSGKGFRTRLFPTKKLLTDIDWDPLDACDMEGDVVELRNAGKEPIDYVDSDFTIASRNKVSSYNTYIERHEVRYLLEAKGQLGLPCDRELTGDWVEEEKKNHGLGAISTSHRSISTGYLSSRPSPPSPPDLHYSDILEKPVYKQVVNLATRRVFNETFSQGGRHYAGYQNLPQAQRATIRIAGQPIVELDFKALHPTMLYHRLGVTPPADCYRIFGDERDFQLRDVVKNALLVLINATTQRQATKALANNWSRGQIRKDRSTNSLNDFLRTHSTSIQDLFARLRDFHRPITDYLGSGEGIRLQRQDADLMADILEDCVDHDLPALPIHDSIIVPAHRADAAKQIMLACYQNRFGYPIAIERKKPTKRHAAGRVIKPAASHRQGGGFSAPLPSNPYRRNSMKPVNLSSEFGDRYKINVDAAWHETTAKDYARRGIHGDAWRKDRQWLYTIPCNKGGDQARIYSFGDRDGPRALAFWGTGRRGTIYERLLEVPGMVVLGDSDLEWILMFPLASFNDVAEIVEPRKKRALSEENRQGLIDAGQDTRFRARNQVTDSSKTGVSHGVQPVETALESTQATQARPEVA